MIARVLRVPAALAGFLLGVALTLRDAVLASGCARVAMMVLRLWPKVAPLAAALGIVLALALWGGISTGRHVFLLLAPASSTGIGAGLAGVLAAVAVAELSALAVLSFLAALLQLAADTGRHRIHALLAIAAVLALLAALPAVLTPERLADAGNLPRLIAATGIVALALWFGRTYRRAGHRQFRDFHLDVTEARFHLAGQPHGR